MSLNTTLSRRAFMKVSAAAGAAATLGAGALSASATLEEAHAAPASEGDVKVVRSCCRACGKNECGVYVTVQNGRAVKVEGDADTSFHSMGNCCSKSQASIQAAYHPDRLYHPMKRTNPKGEADPGWVRISWDEALSTAAQKMNELKEQYGGECMVALEGTSRHWTQFGSSAWMQLLDTPNTITAWQICKGPRHFASAMTSSWCYSWMATTDRPRVYVQWGGASEISNYDESARTTVDLAYTADSHIAVDPRLTNLSTPGEQRLPLIPGTDGALALSWINVIIEENLYDDLYVKRWTNAPFLVCDDVEPTGWEEFTAGSYGRTYQLKTRLLKESDIKEGGNVRRFMVWDELAGKGDGHPLHQNDASGHLTWFDSETGLWENEPEGQWDQFYENPQPNLPERTVPGRVAVPSPFNPDIDPAIYGEFEVALKNGKASKVTPVWEHYRARAAGYAPEKAEGITGVPAEVIRKAAITYATRVDPSTGYGNGGIQYMLANEHTCNALDNCRLLDTICGITGNYDTPAGMRGETISPLGCDAMIMSYSEQVPEYSTKEDQKQLGTEKLHLFNWWENWADAHACWKAAVTGNPYPIRGGVVQASDHMNMGNSVMAYEGLKQMDFFLCIDLWKTPTAGMADILMPAQHWLEVDCPRITQGSQGAIGATVQCIEPPADTLYDPVIMLEMYKAMGVPWLADPEHPYWENMDEYFDYVCDGGDAKELVGGMGMTWAQYKDEFQKNGWWDNRALEPEWWGTYRRYETGHLAKGQEVKGFNTPTKKHEIWSTVIETFFPGDDQEIATWIPAPETPQANPSITEEWPFLMTTGRRIPVYFHSEHRQLPWCRELWPVPRCEINPEDAEKLGIEQGDWVWIESPRGKIRQTADLYHGIRPGVINCEHQWWYPELPQADHGFTLSGINCLVEGENQDRFTGSTNARAYCVKVYKATPENSPFGNPVPCGDDGTEIIHDAADPRLKEWMPNYDIRKEA